MHDFSTTCRDILYILGGIGPCNGKEVIDELEKYCGDSGDQVSERSVYRNLDKLSDLGYVDQTGDYTGKEGEKQYELTDQGEQALEDRREWEDDWLDRSGLDIV